MICCALALSGACASSKKKKAGVPAEVKKIEFKKAEVKVDQPTQPKHPPLKLSKPLLHIISQRKKKKGPWKVKSPELMAALAKIHPSWKQGVYLPIKTQLKPGVMKRILENREVFTNADLEYVGHPKFEYLGGYEFYGVALVRASVRQTDQILKRYDRYKDIIPLVKISRWNKKRKELLLGGSIWKYRMRSWIKIKEKPLKGAEFRIVRGALKGLYGDIYYESAGEKGTIVFVRGFLKGLKWPPKLILEQGAEIALTLAANKMRAYVETHKGEFEAATGLKKKNPKRNKDFPKPRKSL